jgi:hypothetical protein
MIISLKDVEFDFEEKKKARNALPDLSKANSGQVGPNAKSIRSP